MSSRFRFYGVKESNRLETEADRHLEELRIQGFTVLTNVLSERDLQTARTRVEAVYAQQIEEIGGEANLERMNDARVVRCPLVYDEFFLKLATQPALLELVSLALGDYYILMLQNGVINAPSVDNYQASWHRDLNYQHFVCSRPLAVSALFCLDDFTVATGGTFMLPASHHLEAFPSQTYVETHEVPAEAPAGSVLVFDSMLFHRAGHNRSGNTRRGVNHVYALPFLKQQISLPAALEGRYSDDPVLSRLLGYASEPGRNVTEWRQRKLAVLPTTTSSGTA